MQNPSQFFIVKFCEARESDDDSQSDTNAPSTARRGDQSPMRISSRLSRKRMGDSFIESVENMPIDEADEEKTRLEVK